MLQLDNLFFLKVQICVCSCETIGVAPTPANVGASDTAPSLASHSRGAARIYGELWRVQK